MNHKILALLLTVLIGVAGPSFAQSARESTHIVQPGETLAVIAARYEVDLNDLAALNGIFNYHRIYSWQELEIPSLSDEMTPIVVEDRSHVIRYGETLNMIAERYGVDLSELKELNDLYGKVIYPGHKLLLPSPTGSSATVPKEPPVTAQSRQHIVWHGETLGSIAAAYGVNLNELILVNGIFDHMIYPGQALTLPDADGRTLVNSAPDAPAAELSQPIKLGGQLSYTVRAGDTLGDLARHFGITWPAILRANDIIYPYHIYIGQHLWIPSTGSAALNVADVEPAPVPDPPAETIDAATIESPAETSEPEPAETSEPAPAGPPPGDYFEHTIQYGETLGILAIHYGLTVQDLLAANSIDDANHIESGQTLWIPESAKRQDPPPPPQLPETAQQPQQSQPAQQPATEVPREPIAAGDRDVYVVQAGDSLSMIGVKLATDWEVMAVINGIVDTNNLHAGVTLLVPNSDDLIEYGSRFAPARPPDVPDPGARVGVGREFVVVLNTQMAYAYEDGVLKKAALVSTGLPATPTVQGDFKIYRKVRRQRMSGPGYSLDNVEWVMYFYQGYAFHGTWWHTNFGQPQSKGCVNMTNADAKWFYDFASLGTPVHVQYY